jgi:hypothetical protein
MRGRSHEQAAADLRRDYPEIWEHEAFRAGYGRGQQYLEERSVTRT